MTRALTRTNFHSSRLIRSLADLAVLETDAPGGAFAEKLGQWIGFADAITLSAVHNAPTAISPSTPSGAQSVARLAIAEEFARRRVALENSIRMSCSINPGKTGIELPTPKPGALTKDAAAYEPYRRYLSAQQRDMELSVRSLRTKVREQISKASPRLKPLVDLDAALDGILCERESKLLSTVPLLLKRRFDQLLKAHQQTRPSTQQDDNPDLWMKPGAWLARFCSELQTVLLAELNVRLLPTVGLIEAFNNEKIKHT